MFYSLCVMWRWSLFFFFFKKARLISRNTRENIWLTILFLSLCYSHKTKGATSSNMCASSSTFWRWTTSGSATSIERGKGWVQIYTCIYNEHLKKTLEHLWSITSPISPTLSIILNIFANARKNILTLFYLNIFVQVSLLYSFLKLCGVDLTNMHVRTHIQT